MKNLIYTLPLLAALMPLGAFGQLNESVSVDGTYLRDVLHPERINRLPGRLQFSLDTEAPDYDSRGVKADFTPLSPAIGATSRGATRPTVGRLGYVDLQMGSYLNASLSAGGGIIRKPDLRLDLRLQHNSTSTWHPFGDLTDARKSYQENLGLSLAKQFTGLGMLTASAQYHVGYFNYYGVDPELTGYPAEGLPMRLPTQTLQDGALRLGWSSMQSDASPLRWEAGVGLRHFAYRTATRETDLNLTGALSTRAGEHGRAGVDASLHALFYGEHSEQGASSTDGPGTPDLTGADHPGSYAALRLTPFYTWSRHNISLRVGADIDLTFNADGNEPGEHYGAFHAAPDIRFDVAARNVGFYIHLLGGTELHTLAAMSQIDPYRNPHLSSTLPVYTPLDGNIGFQATPFRGFEAALNLRYASTRNAPMEGWYMAWLNYGSTPVPGLDIPAGTLPGYAATFAPRYNLSGFGVDLELKYTPSEVFSIHAKGAYTPQHDTTGIFNGADRPRWILDAGFELSPIRQLTLGVAYQYRGVRRIYTGYTDTSGVTAAPGGSSADASPREVTTSLRLPDLTLLSASLTWQVSRNFSLRAEAANLLNQHTPLLPSQPIEGITFYGGLQWLF